MRTYSPKAHELQNDWLVIDATDVVPRSVDLDVAVENVSCGVSMLSGAKYKSSNRRCEYGKLGGFGLVHGFWVWVRRDDAIWFVSVWAYDA